MLRTMVTGLLSATLLVASVLAADEMPGITPQGHTTDTLPVVKSRVVQGEAVLVDVREPDEWEMGHLAGAMLAPTSAMLGPKFNGQMQLPEAIAKRLPRDRTIYLHCAAGGRCVRVAAGLRALGYDARALKPGYAQLVDEGFATVNMEE